MYDNSIIIKNTLILLILLIILLNTYGDFVYKDFNETSGLILNGDAGTTNCHDDPLFKYGLLQGKADIFSVYSDPEIGESTDIISSSTTETNIDTFNKETTETLAGFLHLKTTASAPNTCNTRARLTPSKASTAGSMWYKEDVPVSNGFETFFTFQITDHSKECTLHKDQYFSQKHHKTCSVHGADGFAFVIQQSPDGTSAIGGKGANMGFGGISNSFAIAFDTWQNPGEDKVGVDHVSIQCTGPSNSNDALEAGLLGTPKAHPLADGKVHLVRIVYTGSIKAEYFDQLIASESLIPFLLDNGEQKRVGTLLVYLDEGIANDKPLLALPINLSLALKMRDDRAYVGFTSSTGRFYEKHDILSWYWCDQEPCESIKKEEFDFHQMSTFNSKVRPSMFVPGDGYGGGYDENGIPSKNQSPDTTELSDPVQHFSKSRTHGLYSNAAQQVPPNTIY